MTTRDYAGGSANWEQPSAWVLWSARPALWQLCVFVLAYVLASGFAQTLAIVPGTGISIWPASGLFLATLVLAPKHSWPWWVAGGFLSEWFGNVFWFHNTLPVAVLLSIGNALEAVVGAWLVSRTCRQPLRLETLCEVLALVVLGAGLAPVISATVGSATLASFGIQSNPSTSASSSATSSVSTSGTRTSTGRRGEPAC